MNPRAKFQPNAVTPLVAAMIVGAVTFAAVALAPYVAALLLTIQVLP